MQKISCIGLPVFGSIGPLILWDIGLLYGYITCVEHFKFSVMNKICFVLSAEMTLLKMKLELGVKTTDGNVIRNT